MEGQGQNISFDIIVPYFILYVLFWFIFFVSVISLYTFALHLLFSNNFIMIYPLFVFPFYNPTLLARKNYSYKSHLDNFLLSHLWFIFHHIFTVTRMYWNNCMYFFSKMRVCIIFYELYLFFSCITNFVFVLILI